MQDGHVTVVQDASEYRGHVAAKAHDARWVRGLSPEDEMDNDPVTAARQRRWGQAARPTTHDTRVTRAWAHVMSGVSALFGARRPFEHWLAMPNTLGLVYLLLLGLQLRGSLVRDVALDFPGEERVLWWYGRRTGEDAVHFCSRVVRPLAVPSALAALYGLALCFRVGVAAQHFTALCGVGLSLLALISCVVQVLLLWLACTDAPRNECDVPFVLYWLCSVVHHGVPLLAVWCVAPVLDFVRRSGVRWRLWLALPPLLFAVALVVTIWGAYDDDVDDRVGESRTSAWPPSSPAALFHATRYVTLVVWAVFWYTCLTQTPFLLVLSSPSSRAHRD